MTALLEAFTVVHSGEVTKIIRPPVTYQKYNFPSSAMPTYKFPCHIKHKLRALLNTDACSFHRSRTQCDPIRAVQCGLQGPPKCPSSPYERLIVQMASIGTPYSYVIVLFNGVFRCVKYVSSFLDLCTSLSKSMAVLSAKFANVRRRLLAE